MKIRGRCNKRVYNRRAMMCLKKEQDKVIDSCVSIIQGELGESVPLHPVVRESLAFFLKLRIPEAKMGYIDHLLNLAVNHYSHIARVFQILMMINVSLEV